jgi:hypothetical protein
MKCGLTRKTTMWLKYSDKPISRADFVDRKQSDDVSMYSKPCGCWITDDSDNCWVRWCLAESFGLKELTHKHEVVLDESRILILRTPADLDLFTDEYSVIKPLGERYNMALGERYNMVCIDWKKVASCWDGLIITPYIWQRRLNDRCSWYYGWDCASGCIWKASAILDIKLIGVAGVEVVETSSSELEADILPLNYTPVECGLTPGLEV